MEKKMEEVQLWAKHIGNVAALIKFIADIAQWATILSFMGPLGFLIAIVIGFINLEVDLGDALESVGWLLTKLADWIWGMLGPDVQAFFEKLKKLWDMGAEAAAVEVSNDIRG
jgi:hypothetical protein